MKLFSVLFAVVLEESGLQQHRYYSVISPLKFVPNINYLLTGREFCTENIKLRSCFIDRAITR